ncbi:MAG: desulfoferrodoxin family protein [Mycoplasma sp.]
MANFIRTDKNIVMAEREITHPVTIVEYLQIKTSDVGFEKHVPYVAINEKGKVTARVGETITHPSDYDHYIVWLKLVVDGKFVETINLKYSAIPNVTFKTDIEIKTKTVEVYAYCNKHGVWKGSL